VDWWPYYKKKAIFVNAIFGILSAGGIGYYLYKSKQSLESILPPTNSPEDIVLHAFKVGKGLDAYKVKDETAFVDRKILNRSLEMILRPKESDQYAVIVGGNGCGKSTAVRKVLSSLQQPRGVVYFDCPADSKEFSPELLSILRYSPIVDFSGGVRRFFERSTKEERDPDVSAEPKASFSRLQKHLVAAATTFQNDYKRPMVLVLDSVDILAKQTPEFLMFLQDFAKKEADKGNLRIVFITSDGSALPLLMSNSSWSRAEKPPFEVGEISDEDAIDYLKKNGIDQDLAEKVVKNITGGLFVMLKDYVSNHRKGVKYDDILQILNKKTKTDLIGLQIQENHPFFKRLIANSNVGTDEATNLDISIEKLELLLKKNILAAHANLTYTFHDRHVSRWFKERNNDV
jgi:hypothetical protein